MKINLFKIIKYNKLYNTFMYLINNNYSVEEAINYINDFLNL